MKNGRKPIPAIIAGMLLFSIIPTLSGCSANKSVNADMSSSTSTSSAESASSSSDVLVKSADGSLSISVPAGWNYKNTTIWPTADIGVSNDANYEYLIVIKKPKSSYMAGLTVDGYITDMKAAFNVLVTHPVWTESSKTTIDNLNGASIQLNGNGRESGTNLEYWISVVEDKNNFYEIASYTHNDLANANQPIIQNIISSFKTTA
jgi:hypothetical protein